MNYLKQLEGLLDNYINEVNERKEKFNELGETKSLYLELIEYLKLDYITLNEDKEKLAKLFYAIYGNDIYFQSLNDILQTLNDDKESQLRFKKLCSNIYLDYKKILEERNNLKAQIDGSKLMVDSINRVKLCFRNKLPIKNKNDIDNVKKIISYYQLACAISNKEEVLLINEIELYNRNVVTQKDNNIERNYANKIYEEIPNILNAGFYLYASDKDDEIEISEGRRNTIEAFIKAIFETIISAQNDKVIDELKQYHDLYKLDQNEYKYIIIKLLDKLFNELYTYYKMLMEKETYINRSNRTGIVSGYYQTLDKYLTLFCYYDEYYNSLTMDEITLEDASNEFTDTEPKRLVYAHSDGDFEKAKIFKDLKSTPFEYYERVSRLLNDYKNNKIAVKEVKTIKVNDLPNNIELRDDQVRIVIKHLRDNIYAVLGLFTKKDDNNPAKYNMLVKRRLPNINTKDKLDRELELASICETDLAELIEKKGRKGNR